MSASSDRSVSPHLAALPGTVPKSTEYIKGDVNNSFPLLRTLYKTESSRSDELIASLMPTPYC